MGSGWSTNLSPEEIDLLASLLEDESEEGEICRQWIGALLVAQAVQDRMLDPESGILAYFATALDETAAMVDRYLECARI